MGYLSTLGILLWGTSVAIGVMLFAALYGILGVLVWLGINGLVAYRLNRARSHWRTDAFDDRLTRERMLDAEEELVKKWKENQG